MALPAGTRLGPYEILLLLARAGWVRCTEHGTRAWAVGGDQSAAGSLASDPERAERFEREGVVGSVPAQINPNIVTIYDIGLVFGRIRSR